VAKAWQDYYSNAAQPSMINWPKIEQFIGYGRLDAPAVFIGMEEGLADEADLQSDLQLRSTFDPVMDLEKAHEGIVNGASLFSDSPRRQPTWRVMADLMLHFEGRTFSSAEERASARRTYRAKRLGRTDGGALLAELLPYPHRNIGSWLYPERFHDRETYVAKILPQRISLLDSVLVGSPRKAIICYGRGDWPKYKQLFAGVKWSTKDRFECASWMNAKITLTDHFVTQYFNTDNQLDELTAVALRQ